MEQSALRTWVWHSCVENHQWFNPLRHCILTQIVSITFRHLWYALDGVVVMMVADALAPNMAPGHQQPPCWLNSKMCSLWWEIIALIDSWCLTAPSHYPSQWWHRCTGMMSGGVTRPQWVYTIVGHSKCNFQFKYCPPLMAWEYWTPWNILFVELNYFVTVCLLSFEFSAGHHGTHRSIQWRHSEHDGVSNDRRLDCLLSLLFRRRSKKTSKLHVTGLRDGNPPVTGGFPSQRASNTESASVWWCHYGGHRSS